MSALQHLPKTNIQSGWPWTEETDPGLYRKDVVYPKITIVTPSYNQGQYIEATIRSILLQNYPNLEYIIIDGASKDNSTEVIQKYAPWLTYWVSEKDTGQSNAINKGFKIYTGEIINWVNSDDILLPGSLFKIAHYFLNNKTEIVIGGSILFGHNIPSTETRISNKDVVERAIVGYLCAQPSTFISRKALDTVGLLDEDLHFTMDWDLYAKIVGAFEYTVVDDILSKQLLHEEGKMVKNAWTFTSEGPLVFSRLVNSVENNEEIVQLLSSLGYYKKTAPLNYKLSNITKEVLYKSFGYFLLRMSHYEYNNFRSGQVIRNLHVLKHVHRAFYDDKETRQLYYKSMIPGFIRKLLKRK